MRLPYLAIPLGVDEDDVVSAVVVARVHQHRVQRVIGRDLGLLLQVRVQVYMLVEFKPARGEIEVLVRWEIGPKLLEVKKLERNLG